MARDRSYQAKQRRRHRRRKVEKLLQRLRRAAAADQKQAILEKLIRIAPWRHAEFARLAEPPAVETPLRRTA